MKNDLQVLKNTIIFKNVSIGEIKNIEKSIGVKYIEYKRGDIIAIEDSSCDYVGIVLEGYIEIQKIDKSGSGITIQRLGMSDIFGEAIVFSSRNSYPCTIVSSTSSKIMFMSKDMIVDLCSQNKVILNNFMMILSEKVLGLNNKIKMMTFKSIRQKIANYILEQSIKQKSNKISLGMNKKQLAEYLGIPRPSLSRELINMKGDGILDFDKKNIIIVEEEELENIMCK